MTKGKWLSRALHVTIALSFVLGALVVAPSVSADPGTSKWEKNATPTEDDKVILPGSDIIDFDVTGSDGMTIYAIGTWNDYCAWNSSPWAPDGRRVSRPNWWFGGPADLFSVHQEPKLWKSTDGGVTWSDKTSKVLDAKNLPDLPDWASPYDTDWEDFTFFTAISAAPDNEDFVVVTGFGFDNNGTPGVLTDDMYVPVVVGSNDGADKFYYMGCSTVEGYITCVDVSMEVDDKHSIAVGTWMPWWWVGSDDQLEDNKNDLGAIWRYDAGGYWSAYWDKTTETVSAGASDGVEYEGWRPVDAVIDVEFSPNFDVDDAIVALTVRDVEDVDWEFDDRDDSSKFDYFAYEIQAGTWNSIDAWNDEAEFDGYPVLINNDDFVIVAPLNDPDAFGSFGGIMDWDYGFLIRRLGDLELPMDYMADDSSDRKFMVAVNGVMGNITSDPDEVVDDGGYLFWVENTTISLELLDHEDNPYISSIDYNGTIDMEGRTLVGLIGPRDWRYPEIQEWAAGERDPGCCSGVPVLYSETTDVCCPDWDWSCKPPSGQFCATVMMTPDGDVAYAGTMGLSRVAQDDFHTKAFITPWCCDESAFSITGQEGEVGKAWNQESLIDTDIDFISDVAVTSNGDGDDPCSPSCNCIYLATINSIEIDQYAVWSILREDLGPGDDDAEWRDDTFGAFSPGVTFDVLVRDGDFVYFGAPTPFYGLCFELVGDNEFDKAITWQYLQESDGSTYNTWLNLPPDPVTKDPGIAEECVTWALPIDWEPFVMFTDWPGTRPDETPRYWVRTYVEGPWWTSGYPWNPISTDPDGATIDQVEFLGGGREACDCDSIWRSCDGGDTWLRIWHNELQGGPMGEGPWEWGAKHDVEWMELGLVPGEEEPTVIYMADLQTETIWVSEADGDACCPAGLGCWTDRDTGLDADGGIADFAVLDADTLYVVAFNGDMVKSTTMARHWSSQEDTKVDDDDGEQAHDIIAWGDWVIVGGTMGTVSYSDDGGDSFSVLDDIGDGDNHVHVAFDSYFDDNGYIYAAVNGDSPGVYRTTIDDADFEDMDACKEVQYTGIAVSDGGGNPMTSASTGGVLYAAYGDAGDCDGCKWSGVARLLDPASQSCCGSLSWDYLFDDLWWGAAFWNEPTDIELCGDASGGATTIWAIDTWSEGAQDGYYDGWDECYTEFYDSNQGRLWKFNDVFSKGGPELIGVEDGATIPSDPCDCVNEDFILEWDRLCDACEYDVEIALDEGFKHKVYATSSICDPDDGWYTCSEHEDCTEGILRGYEGIDSLMCIDCEGPYTFYKPSDPCAPSIVVPQGTLDCNQTYWWRVRARAAETDEVYRSWWSEKWSFTVAVGPDGAIQLTAPVNGAMNVPLGSVVFTWTAVADATSYEMVLMDASGAEIGSNSGDATSFVLTSDLDWDSAYMWMVKAMKGSNVLSESGVSTFHTMSKAVPPPEYPETVINFPEPAPTPTWVWVVIVLAAILVIVVIVLIFRTRRV